MTFEDYRECSFDQGLRIARVRKRGGRRLRLRTIHQAQYGVVQRPVDGMGFAVISDISVNPF